MSSYLQPIRRHLICTPQTTHHTHAHAYVMPPFPIHPSTHPSLSTYPSSHHLYPPPLLPIRPPPVPTIPPLHDLPAHHIRSTVSCWCTLFNPWNRYRYTTEREKEREIYKAMVVCLSPHPRTHICATEIFF